MEKQKYILWCAQESNFQTRTMLIPYGDLSEKRKTDFTNIKKWCSEKIIDHDGEIIRIENLIIVKIEFNGNIGRKKNDYPKHIEDFIMVMSCYANGCDHYDHEENIFIPGICEEGDESWVLSKNFHINIAQGFDHIANYHKLANMTTYMGNQIEIIDSFLVLQMSVYK
jgi:hypothetical protein